MSSFHDVRLPDTVERGAVGGPMFNTSVLELASGHEQRNVNWSQTRATYNIAYGIRYKTELVLVQDFFYARWGKAYGFRFKDWSDYEVYEQILGLGDDSTTVFQAFKRYESGVYYFDRTLVKLVTGTVAVFVEGAPVAFTADVTTGLITLTVAPLSTGGSGPGGEEVVTFTTEFDVPVRFDTDVLNVNAELWNVGSIPSIELVEVRL